MTRRTRQLALASIAVAAAILGAGFLAAPQLVQDAQPPDDVPGMARWLAQHPSDWLTASAIADRSLDSQLPRRLELWRESHRLAVRLAPLRINTSAGYVRAGLFHWYELDKQDRRNVLGTAKLLLRDHDIFRHLYGPLFSLTRDFEFLRRNAPPDAALPALAELAVTNGLFAEYRETREAMRRQRWRQFVIGRRGDTPTELVEILPDPIPVSERRLVQGILEELDRKHYIPQLAGRRIEDLTLFAVRHDLRPLTGLAPLVEAQDVLSDPTRACLALAMDQRAEANRIELASPSGGGADWVPYYLERARFEARHGDAELADGYLTRAALIGLTDTVLATAADVAATLGNTKDAERYRAQLKAIASKPRAWSGTCGENELCTRATTRQWVGEAKSIRVAASVVQTDEVAPYVEIYLDDALVAEGDVADTRTFVIPASTGIHRIDVRLVNPYTRNRIQRRLRLS